MHVRLGLGLGGNRAPSSSEPPTGNTWDSAVTWDGGTFWS